MERNEIKALTAGEILRLTRTEREAPSLSVLHRPVSEDEIDRIGRQIVSRLLEAGVIEPL